MAPKISPELKRQLQTSPDARVHLILRLADVPADVASRLERRGLKVRRQFRLIKAVAVSGKGRDCLTLLNEPWISRIEADHEVHTMD